MVDGNLITARDTAAFPTFCRAPVAALEETPAPLPARRRRGPQAPQGGTGPWRG